MVRVVRVSPHPRAVKKSYRSSSRRVKVRVIPPGDRFSVSAKKPARSTGTSLPVPSNIHGKNARTQLPSNLINQQSIDFRTTGRYQKQSNDRRGSLLQRRRRKYFHVPCCPCSCLAVFLTVLAALLMATAIAAVLLALLSKSRTTLSTSVSITDPATTTINTTSVTITTTVTLSTTTTSISTTTSVATTVTSTMTITDTSTTTTIGQTLLTSTNETVFGIWDTVAGGNSQASLSGGGVGDYYPGEEPDNILDRNITTKYTNFGRCNSSFTNTPADCGPDTGFYLTLQRGPIILSAMQFCTAPSISSRDPMTMTVEGSNQTGSALTLGSSWTLIYNGSTGIQLNTNRSTYGTIQIFSNSIAYASYRVLILTTRNISSAVQYAEVDFLG